MAKDITDANDCVIDIGSTDDDFRAGGESGRLIITSFDIDVTKNRTRQYGIGNRDAQGRTNGNREIDLSFSHMGEASDKSPALIDKLEAGNFTVTLFGDDKKYVVENVDGDFTISVDEEEFTIDFDGDGLSFNSVDR